jgi:HD-GYP domain-containing protein (c-di-GMP phosphodiesterase class II)
MYHDMNDSTLINEEKLALKWFLILFYGIYFPYELFYHTIYKNLVSELTLNTGIWMYFFVLLLLPFSLYLVKRGYIFLVKYYFVIGYIIISVVNELVMFVNTTYEYKTGNAVELFLILFSPFFVNKKFFWAVFAALVSKYVLFGIVLKSYFAIMPLTIIILLSGIAYIILKRFSSYVDAVKSSYDKQLAGIVKGVIATIELKDPYTRGHSERVAHYANTLAAQTGKFSNEELIAFNYACLLHDIGKVNIPDPILMKPGKLTKEEFAVIKTHPQVGADAIKKVDGLVGNIEVIKSHHERWDGKGYPEQLMGNEIPLLARIVSIADAFDAMTSSRSYRAAMSVEEAYGRIVEGQGTQFDPELVELFKEVFPRWTEFHGNYPWPSDPPVKNNTIKEVVTP